jgi:hypothetical protein
MLGRLVNDTELLEECKGCCTSFDETLSVYPHATLIFDKRSADWFPHVQDFISNDVSLFPGLKIKYQLGSYPVLTFQNEELQVMETTSIDTWEKQAIIEFLQAKLINGKGVPRPTRKKKETPIPVPPDSR